VSLTKIVLSQSLFVMLCGTGGLLHAQAGQPVATASASGSVVQRFETRSQLELQARAAESQHRTSEVWLLRSRLEKGDFQEGDRIVVILDGATVATDTLQLRAGKLLQFPRLGDLSLAGVLRSELTDTIRHHLSTYLTNPVVRATPLLPIAVLGTVQQPGFYYVQADAVLRDVIMRAGGPVGAADLNKVVVRRAGKVIWKAEDIQVALADGLSLDALHLRAGDEVFVPERKSFHLANLTTIVSASLAVVLAVVQISR